MLIEIGSGSAVVAHPLGRRNMMWNKRMCTFGLRSAAAAAAASVAFVAYMNRYCRHWEMMDGGGGDGGKML